MDKTFVRNTAVFIVLMHDIHLPHAPGRLNLFTRLRPLILSNLMSNPPNRMASHTMD